MQIGAGRTSDDEVDVRRQVFKAELTDVCRLQISAMVAVVRIDGRSPPLVGRHDLDPGQTEAEAPSSDASVEVDCTHKRFLGATRARILIPPAV